MTPKSPPPTPTNSVQEKIATDIDRVGWAAVGVMPTSDEPGPPLTYTVGLWRAWNHPELIVTGMPGQTAHSLIAVFVKRIEDGETFEGGREYPDAIPGSMGGPYPAAFREVAKGQREEHLKVASWWNGGEEFPTLQALWPDPTGKFPWDEGYDEQFVQPVLALDD